MDNPASVERFKISLQQQREKTSYDIPHFYSSSQQPSKSLEFAPTNSTAQRLNSGLKKRRVELLGKIAHLRQASKQSKSKESSFEEEKESEGSSNSDGSKEVDDDMDLVVAKLLKLSKIEEELASRHLIMWTNYEVMRNQCRSYEKKWHDMKSKLCLLNYECEFLKKEVDDLKGLNSAKAAKYKDGSEKERLQMKSKIINSSIQRGFRAILDSHLLSKYELSWETGFDLFQNCREAKKQGIVVRYMRFDPLMESSSYVNEITRKQQNSYFLNFQISNNIAVFEIFQECCRMWDINQESAILTDQYFNIISQEALEYTPVFALFGSTYRYLSDEKILMFYIFKNEERTQTHIKRLQSHLTDFSQENDFSFFNERYNRDRFSAKMKNLKVFNQGIGVYEEVDEDQLQRLNNKRKCGKGQFILSPFGLISIILFLIVMLITMGHTHDQNHEYWAKKVIQEILLDRENSAKWINSADSFYAHQIEKYD